MKLISRSFDGASSVTFLGMTLLTTPVVVYNYPILKVGVVINDSYVPVATSGSFYLSMSALWATVQSLCSLTELFDEKTAVQRKPRRITWGSVATNFSPLCFRLIRPRI